ncbi:MAG: 5'-nucleotidase [Stygiobacter sp. RIFOXYC12_FULL_38_8]|nr:MAG: 5'-nucleotidase [Stygiobacter sp. RIFOXYA12_FULL_38_9]OGV15141.1 MAG: 5'-nucleotidase [Stygiobacter sp. RIFOXYA2_FULL_38_8]OGV16705.1 MAG: 5'-nucleotidase [Stygiobacter sp. RIFOXYC2_FULL_38_25]OGV24887.1 MAG: 5'-nucleotidase [Stygiobacter sp. RIFOXYC12_FULL_38_8]OGV82944.1 MAG: 5'-nucleotidase [Stygiobacter sp. GWF2_38_21]
MAFDLSNLLVIAISSSALFDTRKEHEIYIQNGVDEYVKYQIDNENNILSPGTAFPLIEAMLRLNKLTENNQIVEVVILSQNEPEASLRIMNSVENHNLSITRAVFTGGENVAKYLKSYNVSLFLSRNETDVKDAIEIGIAAGLLYDPPDKIETEINQLRIAFDGDAVIFSDEAEKIYQEKGLEAFVEHERANAEKPLPEGPFAPFLKIISKIQNDHKAREQGGIPPIRTAIVTARNSPAHKRAILTLRAWGIKVNETFFLGGISKDQILKEFRPHIFFDDQEVHAKPASALVPSARVPVKKVKKQDKNQLAIPLFENYSATNKQNE